MDGACSVLNKKSAFHNFLKGGGPSFCGVMVIAPKKFLVLEGISECTIPFSEKDTKF